MSLKKALLMTALALTAALASVPSAQAAFGDFSYTTSLSSPNPSTVDGSSSGVATLSFAAQSPTGALIGSGTGTDITPIILTLNGVKDGTTDFNVAVDFIVNIKDLDSGKIEKVEFKSTLSGSVTVGNPAASNLSLSGTTLTVIDNQIPSPVYYDVTANAFLPPGPGDAGSSSQGGISLHVRAVPEPKALALMGLGGIGYLGLLRRRKRAG